MQSNIHKKTIQEIENEYKNSVEIPNIVPEKQFFFCPVGIVGSGKTTVTKAVSKKLGLLRLSSDELRKLLKENGHDYSSVKEIGFRIAEEFVEKKFSIAFDMDCGNPESKEFVERLSEKYNVKIIWVHINTPEEHILKGLLKDAHYRAWLAEDPQIMIRNYFSQKEKRLKENTKFDYFFTFDTSKSDMQEQISECVEKIKKAL